MSGSITILYGSETGNAEDFARYLSQKLQYYLVTPSLHALDEFPLKKLVTQTRYLIIVCSTTGQGELPRNAKKFMKFMLKKKLPSDLLNHIELTTFGLGDSSYSKYNYAIKKIHARLVQLGCSELSPRCEADEMSPEGVDGYYKEWENQLIAALQKKLSIVSFDDSFLLPVRNIVEIDEDAPDITVDKSVALSRDLKHGKLVQNKRVTASDHFQDVRHVIIESEELLYLPGDTVALYPANDDKDVEALIQLQPHWIPFADKPLTIQGDPLVEGGFINKSKLTLRSLLTYHLDLNTIPRRSFFMLLWQYVDASNKDGDREQERLKEFASFEEPQELYDYANRPRRLILETVLEFEKNLEIPIKYIFDLFPTIKPRLFLIASRPSATSVELVVGIVEYKTMIRRIRRGLCSRWLKTLEVGDDVVFSIHASNIKFDPVAPLILIAPGTGIAPMKSLVEEVAGNQPIHLFYGCRHHDKDYLFGDLWESLDINIYPCFSRDPDSKARYVQDGLFKEYKLIADLIYNHGATVFVCGSSGKMPKQVRITIAEALVKAGNLAQDAAEQYVLSMEDSGRYKEDVW